MLSNSRKRLIQQHNVIPAITLVGYVSFEQLASKDFRGDDIPLELILAFENEINDKFSISYNVGTTNGFDVLNYTLNCSYTPKEKITTFIEYFSTVTKVGTVHNADAGVMYLINPRWQLDIACGGFIKGSSTDFYTTFGFAHIF